MNYDENQLYVLLVEEKSKIEWGNITYSIPAKYFNINGEDTWLDLETSTIVDKRHIKKVIDLPFSDDPIWENVERYKY